MKICKNWLQTFIFYSKSDKNWPSWHKNEFNLLKAAEVWSDRLRCSKADQYQSNVNLIRLVWNKNYNSMMMQVVFMDDVYTILESTQLCDGDTPVT